MIWAIVGTILALLGAALFGTATAFFTRGITTGRKRAIIIGCALPFAWLAWSGTVIGFQAVINNLFLHRDLGFGDTWECPLPNGYALMMVDETDQGWVFNPKTQLAGGVAEQEDALAGVRFVQIADRYILGSSDTRNFEAQDQNKDFVNQYFILDTRSGTNQKFPTYDALKEAAHHLGIEVKLERISDVYSRYRFTWFDVLVVFLLLVPVIVSLSLFVRWIVHLRRTRVSALT